MLRPLILITVQIPTVWKDVFAVSLNACVFRAILIKVCRPLVVLIIVILRMSEMLPEGNHFKLLLRLSDRLWCPKVFRGSYLKGHPLCFDSESVTLRGTLLTP